jgi:hypothetical protein
VSLHVLQVEGEVGDLAEEREPDDEADSARDAVDAVAKDLQRHDRLCGAPLGEREGCEQRDCSHDKGDHRR